MARAPVESAQQPAPHSAHALPHALQPSEIAWLAVIPCALVTTAAVAFVGPPFGRAFLGPGSEAFWPIIGVMPEPAEHGRFLLALLGPLLLVATILELARRRQTLSRPAPIRQLVLVGQVATIGFLLVCFAAQRGLISGAQRPASWETVRYFTWPTLIVSSMLPLVALALLRSDRVRARRWQILRERRAVRLGALTVATLFTAVWMLTAVNADSSIGNTATGVSGHILWSMGETFAILDGRTPLVNFHSQYGQLWPYVTAAGMAIFGSSIGAYTTIMVMISGLSLIAIYGVFRRLVHSSMLALGLYLPFVATGFFMKLGPLADRYGPASLFSLWPVRYGGPYLLAWLLVRRLDGTAPRRLWVLFFVAGLTILNNPEFGVPALVAMVVALLLVQPPDSRQVAGRQLASAALGLGGAVLAVTALTLARSGSLPRFGLMSEFSRLYGIGGWAMTPMPNIGIYLAVFVTFAAALVVAVVRSREDDDQPLLTAMLAWSGTFGLIIGGYFAGRSHPQVLIDLFSPWALSLALLLIVVVRDLAARSWRHPSLPQIAVLFGFALAICSLPQTPTPWSQIARIRDNTPEPLFKQLAATRFIDSRTQPGEKVEILVPLGHRIAYDLDLVNVSPYASIESIPTRQQLDRTIDTLRDTGATKIFISQRFTFPEERAAFEAAGFTAGATSPDGETVELTDATS